MLQTDYPRFMRRRQRNQMLKLVHDEPVKIEALPIPIEPTPKGSCAKCGKHVGRGVVLHARKCKG